MVIEFKWERLTKHSSTFRAKVIGGWVVSDDVGLVFVPDPNHEWQLSL